MKLSRFLFLSTLILLPIIFGILPTSPAQADETFARPLSANGDFLWAKSLGSVSDDEGRSITTDSNGNVYTTGFFRGTVDFDPGAGTTSLTSAGFLDIFVSKLDSNGGFVWAKRIGGTGSDTGYSIAIGSTGNIYITGSFEGTVDFNPNAGTANLISAGQTDIFVSKLDGDGNFVWAKNMGGTSIVIGYGIAVDLSGNVYTTGGFFGTADFNPGAGVVNMTNLGEWDAFISKLNNNGDFVWAKQMSGTGGESGFSLATDSDSNVYAIGSFSLTTDFDPGAATVNLTSAGSNDIFISKLDSGGNFVWAKSISGVDDNVGFGIAVDSSSNVYTTGAFFGTADFDPGLGTANLISAGQNDIFVSKLNSNGGFVWAKRIGETGSDGGFDVALDSSDNIYTTGYFSGTVDFDPGAGTSDMSSAGSLDIFVSKLNSNGDLLWAKGMGGTNADKAMGIALVSSYSIHTTGSFWGTADFDPGASTFNLVSAGNSDIFVTKLEGAAICSPAIIVENDHDAGAGSLRQAITDVCSGGTITFDPSLSAGPIYLASSLIIDKNLTIDGSALSSQIIISGDTDNNGTGDVGVFNINSGVTTTLSDLKIEKGYRTGGRGGGIHNLGTLNVINCTLTNNFAANGGGIANDIGATLNIMDSSILNNSSQNDGGGIYNYGGTLTLTRSIISNNFSANFGGGGIANNTSPTSTATSIVTNSTVSNNSTTGYGGGGIVNSGMLTVINSTLANNAASLVVGDGGGLLSIGTATFSNSTISGNTAGRNGGGIYTGSALHLKNTIIANSTSGGDCYNTQGDSILTNTNNLIEANGTSGHKCGTPVSTSDPKLGPLADNGGTTQTFAIPFDSPAVDAGNDASCESTDQRGVARPQGAHCDIGAFEYYQPNIIVLNANNSGAGSLRQAISETASGGTITFDTALSGQTIHLASLLLVDKSVTIDGSSLASHIQISGDTDNNGTGDVSVFQISVSSTVELNNLDIVKGKGSGASGGGGIANYGTLAVKNSTLSANSYTGGIGGGGIYNKGTLTIIDSTITGNIAEDAGGIFNEYGHTLTITGSTFSNNSAQSANTLRGGGGGIANIGTLSVDDSIFLENIAYSGGGAIVNSIDGTSTVTNSSFTGNSSFGKGVGGAINNYEGGMTIENCTFTENSDFGGESTGGAVYNGDQMNITNSIFEANSGAYGGAIANRGTVTIADSTLFHNSADSGGGIVNVGELTITHSSIMGNSVAPILGFGGGIANNAGGILTITDSIISDHSAPHGGGIFNFGEATITNSTIAENSAGYGGGIFNLGTFTGRNNTLSDNSAVTSGGGMYSSGTLNLANTIIANSTNGADCVNDGGTIGMNTNNLVENNAASPNQCGIPLLTSDPKLGSLADNGGSTLTISLLPGSPAIDAGDDAVCAAAPVNNTSQNGVTRPLGAHCDIGSFEYVDTIAPAVLSIVRANANPTAATSVDFTVTFSEIVTGVGSADFNITRTGVSGAAVSGVTGSGSVYTVTVSTGTGEGLIRLDIPASAVIKDLSNNSLNGLPYITGQTYSIKHPSIPRPPVLRSPRTNFATNDATPTFWWARVKDGQSYEIVFATDAAFSIGVVSQVVNEPSYAVAASISDDEYFWHVRAYNSANQYGPWSSTRSFTIDTTGPLAPQLNSPLDTDSLSRTPIFKWEAVSGAVFYEFQYDDDADFLTPYKVTTRGAFRRPAAMKIGTYFWRVRAKDASGNWGEWSAPCIVTIAGP